jgi:hypothetical protein
MVGTLLFHIKFPFFKKPCRSEQHKFYIDRQVVTVTKLASTAAFAMNERHIMLFMNSPNSLSGYCQ